MIGEIVKKRMSELGRTQAELSRLSGLSTGHISDIVNGKKGPAIALPTLTALADALDVQPSYFFSQTHSHKRVKSVSKHTKKRVRQAASRA